MSRARSNKNKGRLGQQEVCKILLDYFPALEEDDVVSRPMGSPGEDIMLSPAARRLIPFNIEVKRGKAFNVVKAVKQAEVEGRSKYPGVGVGRYDNDKQWYACVRLEVLLNLLIKVDILRNINND